MSDEIVLIGAGGHAKVVLESALSEGFEIAGFVDPNVEDFARLQKLYDDNLQAGIISFGAVEPEGLQKRHELFEKYQSAGVEFPVVCDIDAKVSETAEIDDGSYVAPGVIINAEAKIGKNCIINTGAIIEHDVKVGNGCHIAPGAIVLGGAEIGDFCMIGAGAVILPNAKLPANTMVKALERYGS